MKKYLFIDAAYLNFRLKAWSEKYFDSHPIELDYQKLTEGYDKTFYYDALAVDDSTHEDFLNSLRELPDFHVFTGTLKGENKRKRQKQVDIMLAVHALTHTIRGNMESITLLAGDEDFTPLVTALIQEGMNVTVWAALESLSKELKYSADRRELLSSEGIWHVYSNEKFRRNFPPPARERLSPMRVHQLKYEVGESISTTKNHTLHFLEENNGEIKVLYNLDTEKLAISGGKETVLRYLKMRGEDTDVLKLQKIYKLKQ
jgi:uncharacterized LabA/DUF88 family protein